VAWQSIIAELKRRLGLPPRVAAGFGVAVAALLISTAFSLGALSARTTAVAELSHTSESLLAVEEMGSALLVSDSALDAYVASGARRQRDRHLRARGKLKPGLAELVALADGDAIHVAIVARLEPALESVVADQSRAVALADGGDRQGARAARGRAESSRGVDDALGLLDELRKHEAAQMAGRSSALDRTQWISNVVVLLAQLVLLVLMLLAARLVRDEIAAREQHEAQVARAHEIQQRLVAMVSHDLRSPLSGILSAAWTLGRGDTSDDAKRIGRRIGTAGRRMERLIRDLLDWSRANAGAEIPVHVEQADLFDVCSRVAEDLGDARAQRLELAHEGDTRALFDPDRMEQVIANLVTNALKYGNPDRPVRIRAAGEDGTVRVEVQDEGPGLDPSVLAALFKPFRRAPEGAAVGASSVGLGLFVVRTLADAQGAEVVVRTAPGEGTTFVVRVKRAHPIAPPPA
jgi:signal transduction histidine kinase